MSNETTIMFPRRLNERLMNQPVNDGDDFGVAFDVEREDWCIRCGDGEFGGG